MSLDNPLAGVEVGSSTVGDVGGDGTLDLVITGFSSGNDETSTLYENRSSQNYQVASVTQPVSGDGTTAFGDTGVEIQFAATRLRGRDRPALFQRPHRSARRSGGKRKLLSLRDCRWRGPDRWR